MASASYSSKGGGGGGGGSGPGPDFITPITVTLADAATATATRALTLTHSTSGISAAGFGTSILFRGEDDGGNAEDMATLNVQYSNTAVGTEGTYFSFSPRNNGGALTERARIGPVYSSFLAITLGATIGDLSNRIEADGVGMQFYTANGAYTAKFHRSVPASRLPIGNVERWDRRQSDHSKQPNHKHRVLFELYQHGNDHCWYWRSRGYG